MFNFVLPSPLLGIYSSITDIYMNITLDIALTPERQVQILTF